MEPTLTPMQQVVLDAVRALGADGWPVTVREVQAVSGHASTSNVHSHLTNLERLGLVFRSPRHPRSGWKA